MSVPGRGHGLFPAYSRRRLYEDWRHRIAELEDAYHVSGESPPGRGVDRLRQSPDITGAVTSSRSLQKLRADIQDHPRGVIAGRVGVARRFRRRRC